MSELEHRDDIGDDDGTVLLSTEGDDVSLLGDSKSVMLCDARNGCRASTCAIVDVLTDNSDGSSAWDVFNFVLRSLSLLATPGVEAPDDLPLRTSSAEEESVSK